LKMPSRTKRQHHSPPAPGSPAFEELPAISISFVFILFYYCARTYSAAHVQFP
jgi:hypothetical protein